MLLLTTTDMKKKKSVWDFFASVKLALCILSILACTSIIGTVIPQKKPLPWYAQEYGDNLARLFNIFDIPDMYSSWWFLLLLGLLSTNLIICSFDRFPGVWKQIKADGLDTSLKRLQRMGRKKEWRSNSSVQSTLSDLIGKLNGRGWKSRSCDSDEGILLFAQKGAYSRAGVYLVHASILIIFVGAIIGEFYGFKGSIMIPETQQTDTIYAFNSSETINLGFTIRCDSFAVEFYPNGMAKEYTSTLTVLENGKEIFQTPIEVNSPLTYRGVTFYQSSYEGYNDFIVKVTNKRSGNNMSSIIPFQEQRKWTEEDLTYGIINAEMTGQSVLRIKMWVSDGREAPSVFWLKDGDSTTVERENGAYLLSAKQMYGTGLQVCKDPGVWVVYIGCGLMLLGLVIAFFMSHKRIWLFIKKDKDGVSILLTGSANKNRVGFAKIFDDLAETLQLTQERIA